MARVVPPAWSPVGARTLAASLAAVVSPASARRRLREELSRRYGADQVVPTDSGTTALRLAVRAAAGSTNLPVALPAWGCFDLATALDGAGLPARLYDVDPSTLGPDWDHFRSVVAAGVSSAVVVHPFGLAVDAVEAASIAGAAGVPLIEDAAQAAGARLQGQPVGSLGDLAVLSFGRGKGLTGGGGGAVLARQGPLQDRIAGMAPADGPPGFRNLAVLAALLWVSPPPLFGLVAALPFLGLGETPYHPPHAARGLSRVAAGAVVDTLARLDPAARDRGVAAARLRAAAGDRGPVVLRASEPAWLRFPVILPGDATAGSVSRLGVARGYPRALIDLPGFGERVINRADGFAGARHLATSLYTVPTHRWVAERDLVALVRWLESLTPAPGRRGGQSA